MEMSDDALWPKMLQSFNQILVQNGSNVWHHFFLFNFSAIFEVVSYLEEGSWGGGLGRILKPFFKKGLKKVLCLGLWHRHHDSSWFSCFCAPPLSCDLNSLPYPPS